MAIGSTLVDDDMQTIVMTEMLQATARFLPNGQPIDPGDEHRRVFLDKGIIESRSRKPGDGLRTLRATIVQYVAGFHLGARSRQKVP